MIYKGRLVFMGWDNPWVLSTGNGDIDIRKPIDEILVRLDGQLAEHNNGKNFYSIWQDNNSKFRYSYNAMCLNKVDEFGFSNVQAYLENGLVWLSGRLVEIYAEGSSLKIVADPSEKVFGVYFTKDNYCAVSDEDARGICKPGGTDCCVFLGMGATGFQCLKFAGPTARMLLDRLAQDTIRAKRIGNCEVLGRKDQSTS